MMFSKNNILLIELDKAMDVLLVILHTSYVYTDHAYRDRDVIVNTRMNCLC